jgi:hypothetical protein
MDSPPNSWNYQPIWIWSLLMAVAVVAFFASGNAASAGLMVTVGQTSMPLSPFLVRPGQTAGGLSSPNLDVFRFLTYVAAASAIAVRAALLVAILYLLRFLRYHLLPPLFAQRPRSAPAQPPAPRPPEASFTLTGSAIVESAEEQDSPHTLAELPGNADGAGLLWRALAAIAIALSVEVAASAVVVLTMITA